MNSVLIIIVTHNNEKHLQWNLDGINKSQNNITVYIVDSGSDNHNYIKSELSKHKTKVTLLDNVGFVAANNFALESVDISEYDLILFLNPDARIDGEQLDSMIDDINKNYQSDSIFSVPLIKYNMEKNIALKEYDSLGIYKTWYGKWYDKRKCDVLSDISQPHAICGAFMLFRTDVISKYKDSTNRIGLERTYFMYKEDIEICMRMRANSIRTLMLNKYYAYHCRGWGSNRKNIPFWAKWHSAKNDLDLALRFNLSGLPFALVKCLLVLKFNW